MYWIKKKCFIACGEKTQDLQCNVYRGNTTNIIVRVSFFVCFLPSLSPNRMVIEGELLCKSRISSESMRDLFAIIPVL